MKNFEIMEEKLIVVNSMLELIKTYCEHNIYDSQELSVLYVALELILEKQQELINDFDKISTSKCAA